MMCGRKLLIISIHFFKFLYNLIVKLFEYDLFNTNFDKMHISKRRENVIDDKKITSFLPLKFHDHQNILNLCSFST